MFFFGFSLSSSVDTSLKDDVTVILPLGVCFQMLTHRVQIVATAAIWAIPS
jgi:hypothetical protein